MKNVPNHQLVNVAFTEKLGDQYPISSTSWSFSFKSLPSGYPFVPDRYIFRCDIHSWLVGGFNPYENYYCSQESIGIIQFPVFLEKPSTCSSHHQLDDTPMRFPFQTAEKLGQRSTRTPTAILIAAHLSVAGYSAEPEVCPQLPSGQRWKGCGWDSPAEFQVTVGKP